MHPRNAIAHEPMDVRQKGLKSFARISIVIFILVGLACLTFYGSNEYVLFTSVGFFSLSIMLIPIAILKNYDPLSTWTLTCLSVLLGCVIRGVYIGLGYPDYETLDSFYFLGQRGNYFIEPALILLVCLICCVIGYMVGPKRKHRTDTASLISYKRRRIYFFAYFALFVSLGCTILYVQLTGGFDFNNLSKKRTLIDSLNLAAGHRTYGVLRSIAGVAMLAHLLVLADVLSGDADKRLPKYMLAGILFLIAIFLPFYSSARGTIFLYVLLSLTVTYYFNRKIQWTRIIVILFCTILVFQAMSVLRGTRDISFTEAVTENPFSMRVLDKLVLNRNDLELGKTAHIINSVPERLDWQYGKTIAVWAAAFVPRSIWNSKPLVSSGPIIGTVVYGNRISGVPPGMVAEFYWNFHIAGVIIGGILFGWMLRWLDMRFKPDARDTPARIVVYVYGAFPFGYLTIGTAFGYGVLNTAINILVATVVLKFVKVR